MTQSLDCWLPYIQNLHPKTVDLSLDRVQAVGAKLGVLSFSCPVVTVGGTNGKGSCIAFLQSILSHAGYRTGCYSSPHLINFCERIQIASVPVSPDVLIQAFAQVDAARGLITLTYFEFTTLAALFIFKMAGLDILLLEVGLGGRLDAVNIVASDIAAVTTIDLDHTHFLGNTREKIAYEKAGIFKKQKIAICGDYHPPEALLSVAKDRKNTLYRLGVDFSFTAHDIFAKDKTTPLTWSWHSEYVNYPRLPLPQLPLTSAAVALMIIQCLNNDSLPTRLSAITSGIQSACLPGRYQCLDLSLSRFSQQLKQTHCKQLILDVAHNPQAARYLANKLGQDPVAGRQIAIVGMLADKDIAGTLGPLRRVFTDWYLTQLPVPGSAHPDLLARLLTKDICRDRVHSCDSILQAFLQALDRAGKQDRIVAFGSFHVVGKLLFHLG